MTTSPSPPTPPRRSDPDAAHAALLAAIHAAASPEAVRIALARASDDVKAAAAVTIFGGAWDEPLVRSVVTTDPSLVPLLATNPSLDATAASALYVVIAELAEVGTGAGRYREVGLSEALESLDRLWCRPGQDDLPGRVACRDRLATLPAGRAGCWGELRTWAGGAAEVPSEADDPGLFIASHVRATPHDIARLLRDRWTWTLAERAAHLTRYGEPMLAHPVVRQALYAGAGTAVRFWWERSARIRPRRSRLDTAWVTALPSEVPAHEVSLAFALAIRAHPEAMLDRLLTAPPPAWAACLSESDLAACLEAPHAPTRERAILALGVIGPAAVARGAVDAPMVSARGGACAPAVPTRPAPAAARPRR